MIPAVMDFLPRRRRAVPPPEPGAWPFQAVTQHGSTGRQAAGPDPSWPEDWQRDWPLDPAVFGAVPRVREP